jgi:glycosyltransferase involved in cell wall biosynthesis
MERALSPLTDKIIAISRCEDELARTYRLPGDKLVLIYSGIASEYKAPKSSFALDKSRINLLFAGRHDRQKGLDILLDAMRAIEHCPVHLHVVGAGVLSEARTERGDRPNVTFHGWVPRDTVIEFLAETDAVVLPSRWEGLPLAALEAMRMGRAVIASDRSALPEIVQHGRTGLIIDIDSPDRVVETLRSLDRNSLRDMGRAGRDEFLQRFTAERMNRELNDLYHAVVSRRRASTRKPMTNTRGVGLQPPRQSR